MSADDDERQLRVGRPRGGEQVDAGDAVAPERLPLDREPGLLEVRRDRRLSQGVGRRTGRPRD
jgi:hypothetical protein